MFAHTQRFSGTVVGLYLYLIKTCLHRQDDVTTKPFEWSHCTKSIRIILVLVVGLVLEPVTSHTVRVVATIALTTIAWDTPS